MFSLRILLLFSPGLCGFGNATPLPITTTTHIHPFYVSVAQVEENTKERILEITCKIFTEDFEQELRKNFNVHVNLLSPDDKPAMEKLINNYIKAHLQVSVDGKKCVLQFIGFEQEEDAVYCYFQVSDITVNKTVEIVNSILFDYKPEQINIVHVTARGIRKSRELVNPDSRASFDFP